MGPAQTLPHGAPHAAQPPALPRNTCRVRFGGMNARLAAVKAGARANAVPAGYAGEHMGAPLIMTVDCLSGAEQIQVK